MSGAATTLRRERLDESFLAEVRERTPLSSLVADHVSLQRSGAHEVGSCPFHAERTASFHVYKDHYHCFGCGAHGDAIKYRQEMSGEGFRDAVRALAQAAGLEMPGERQRPVSAEETSRRADLAAERARLQEVRDREKANVEEAVARKAERVWAGAQPADPAHPYLVSKSVEPHDLRQDDRGRLLVPLRDATDGKLWNLQTITAEGDKRTLYVRTVEGAVGGRTKGLAHIMGDVESAPALAIAEGYATAASVLESTKLPVAMDFSWSNHEPVGRALRERYPDKQFVYAADNDVHLPLRPPRIEGGAPNDNVGLTGAQRAAEVTGGIVLVPPAIPERTASDKGTDWNDYTLRHGLAAVAGQFAPHLRLGEARNVSEATTVVADDVGRRESLEQRIRAAPTFAELKSLLLDEQVARDRNSVARDPEQRIMLDKAVDETRQRLLAGQPLSRDAQIIHAAIETVVADRQASASPDVRRDLANHAALGLAEREERSGAIQLPQAALGVIDMDRFSALVRGVQEMSPRQEPVTEPQAVRPIAIRTSEEMAETARLLREGAPSPAFVGHPPSASAVEADALAAGKLRTNLEERIGASRTTAELQGLLAEERFREDRQALAGHPAQVAAIAAAIEETEAKLRIQAQRPPLDTAATAPAVELTRRGSNSAPGESLPDDPERIRQAYVVREREGERQYFQRADGQLAIRADDTHIRGVLRDASTIGAMLDLAEARGWNDVVVRGDRDVARETWLQASLRGLAVEGFRPTRDDLHDLQQRRLGGPHPPPYVEMPPLGGRL